jgi:hypothetical protein
MFRVFSGDNRETILVCNRREPKENRLEPATGKGGARITLQRSAERRKRSAAGKRNVLGERI